MYDPFESAFTTPTELSSHHEIQVSTTAESHAATQPEDAPDGDRGGPTLTPGEDSLGEVMEITTTLTELSPGEAEATTEDPSVEENSFRGSENGTVGPTFTPVEYDQPTGSGMQPPLSEEEAASPTASVGEPEESQHSTTENQREEEHIEPEAGDARTECKKNKYKYK